MSDDPLSDVVTMARARCDVSASLVAGGAWALAYPPPRQTKFMAIVAGGCWLRFGNVKRPHWIGTGDIVMLSGSRPYVLASDVGVSPRDATALFADPLEKHVRLGDTADFVTVGGHVTLDPERGWLLGDVLPPFLHIKGGSPEASPMRFLLDQLVAEAASHRPGADLMSQQLAQLLFILTMRAYLSTSGQIQPSWIKALGDKRIALALRVMHREPGRPWRLHELADIVAMSRTSFAVHFKKAAGIAPLTYLLNWRMRLAEQALRTTSVSIATLALSLGYTSGSAFSNAFKRVTGMAPSRYRSRQPAAGSAPPPSS
ncbi:MAG TPA: AraC family transcriptional regulator [Vineibacter sp.]|nr:AraC family transcriptional regulator [Vineibacter sp.]